MAARRTGAETSAPERLRIRAEGIVQGVGFRPHVHRIATELDLGGFVLNDSRGVLVEVEGRPADVQAFARRLADEAPPAAAIERLIREPLEPVGERRFAILASDAGGEADAAVSPDLATCDQCLAELFDPADRRHRYPFINCTNCGPRFTIVRGVPYDRPRTTMAGFEMCAACRAEYEDPSNRRFHAQPNACPECGPRARLVDRDGLELDAEADPLAAATALLVGGAIVAIKGIGGYHLACAAADERAVAELRARKHRDQKPLALLVADLAAARELVELSASEQELLLSDRRPIVVARRRPGARVSADVAPRSRDLGVMLPYSPLHHLIAAAVRAPLVLTSGNVADEPIAFTDDDALERLGPIADALLVHDRPIETRTDDSVVRSLGSGRPEPLLIRRSRGYAPSALELPLDAEPVLGCGAELKNTFCLARGRHAWVSHHIGDLKNWETLSAYERGIAHFERLFAVTPAVVAHDLHPDYLATRHALERAGVEAVAVQHHHAHLAATLAEHGVRESAVGAIFDGAGYGGDGTVWGGEILVGGLESCERAGLLLPVRLPGGDAAAREPWRMACAWLSAALATERPPRPATLAADVSAADWEGVSAIAAGGVGSPLTTSAGRLFDGVAAICGLRARVAHEGQAAAELEGLADPSVTEAYPFEPPVGGDPTILDPREAIRALTADLGWGVDVAVVAARFHNGLAVAIADACARVAETRGLRRAVLSGGVFQNRLLVERASAELRTRGLEVLLPERLPPNDAQISFGQVAVAVSRAAD